MKEQQKRANKQNRQAEPLPGKVTLQWMMQHVPVQFYVWAGGILFTVALASYQFGTAQRAQPPPSEGSALNSPVEGPAGSPSLSAAETARLDRNTNKDGPNKATAPDQEPVKSQPLDPDSLFVPGNPFPKPFNQFRLGTKASTLVEAFPDSGLRRDRIHINFNNGPFEMASYSFDNDRIDPSATEVYFHIRQDEASVNEARKQVFAAFHDYKFETSRVRDEVYCAERGSVRQTRAQGLHCLIGGVMSSGPETRRSGDETNSGAANRSNLCTSHTCRIVNGRGGFGLLTRIA